ADDFVGVSIPDHLRIVGEIEPFLREPAELGERVEVVGVQIRHVALLRVWRAQQLQQQLRFTLELFFGHDARKMRATRREWLSSPGRLRGRRIRAAVRQSPRESDEPDYATNPHRWLNSPAGLLLGRRP